MSQLQYLWCNRSAPEVFGIFYYVFVFCNTTSDDHDELLIVLANTCRSPCLLIISMQSPHGSTTWIRTLGIDHQDPIGGISCLRYVISLIILVWCLHIVVLRNRCTWCATYMPGVFSKEVLGGHAVILLAWEESSLFILTKIQYF